MGEGGFRDLAVLAFFPLLQREWLLLLLKVSVGGDSGVLVAAEGRDGDLCRQAGGTEPVLVLRAITCSAPVSQACGEEVAMQLKLSDSLRRREARLLILTLPPGRALFVIRIIIIPSALRLATQKIPQRDDCFATLHLQISTWLLLNLKR